MLVPVIDKETQTHDLKFLVDLHTKIQNIHDQVVDNIHFNSRCNRDTENLPYQNDWENRFFLMKEKVWEDISIEVENHPVWEWASQLKGIRGDLLGLIVGSIRFTPPKTNITSNDSGRERWAHSIGALLTFCGLNDRNNNQKQYHNNSRVLDHIRDQVFMLIQEGNSYHAPYQKFIQLQREAYKSNYYEPSILEKKIKDQAVYNMQILFMKHIYLVVRESAGLEDTEHMSLLCSPWDLIEK